MPELPEVEVVRRGLEQWVVARRILGVEVYHPRSIRRHLAGREDFTARLAGQKVLAARRRGKYFWLPLESGEALLGHLGMSGQLLLRPAATPNETHLRVRFRFDDGDPELRFIDQRTFGGLIVTQGGEPVPPAIAHIARDPLDQEFDAAAFARVLRSRRTGIKRALLDQSLISGVGNIYADEGLWRAKLHYARPTETLTRAEISRLIEGIREVMAAALAAGGTSFDSLYVDVNGESGYFERSLEVYGRRGEPCSRCGAPIRRDSFTNRSSYSCPRCQRRPRRAHW